MITVNLKKPTGLLLICFLALASQAQLAGTIWKGNLPIPDPTDILWIFHKDSCYLYLLPDSVVVETMTYKVDKNVMTIAKVSGNSPCDSGTPGSYTFEIRDEKLYITLNKDDCQDRGIAFGRRDPLVLLK